MAQGAEQRESHTAELAVALVAFYEALRVDVLGLIDAGRLKSLVGSLWASRLTDVLRDRVRAVAHDVGPAAAAAFSDDPSFDAKVTDHYLEAMAENVAAGRVADLRGRLDGAVADDDAAASAGVVFEGKADDAPNEAAGIVNAAANFTELEAAIHEGMTTKTWVTGKDPRASHAALDGVTVPIDDRFPNGLRYPGSPGPPQETANCNCRMTFGRS